VNKTLEGAKQDLLKILSRTWDEEYSYSTKNIDELFENADLNSKSENPIIEFRMQWQCDESCYASVTVCKIGIGH